jgi:hypothetical protein
MTREEIGLPNPSQTIMSVDDRPPDISSRPYVVSRHPPGCPFVAAGARYDTNRPSWSGRAFHCLCRSGVIEADEYGQRRGTPPIVGFICICAGILEYRRHFTPSRHPSLAFRGIGTGACLMDFVPLSFFAAR